MTNLSLWRGPPLTFRILALLLGGLVVAQFVTLLLTLVLPPAPSPQHSLSSVAAALRGEEPGEDRPDRLERVVQAAAPDLGGAGWVVSDRSRQALARMLGSAPGDVRLAFYTPLPFAGTGVNPRATAMANDGLAPPFAGDPRFLLAQAPGPPPGGGMGGGPGGAMPGFPPGASPGRPLGDLPNSAGAPPRDALSPGIRPGGPREGMMAPGLTQPGGPLVATPPPGPLFQVTPPADMRGGT